MESVREQLRINLISLLKSNNMSQKDLSVKLGVTQAAVSNWIKGNNSPNIEVVYEICSLFHVSVSELLETEYNPPVIQTAHPLLAIYESLNRDGQEELMNYAKYIAASPKYKKCSELSEADHVG